LLRVEAESVVASNPNPSPTKLTGGQKWIIALLILLQVPSSLIFYPLAAVLALTGILVPVSVVLIGVGTMPYSFAMKCKSEWQSGGGPDGSRIAGDQDTHVGTRG
jgi:hypothetical protein